jgi:hypothetical protein
MPWEETGLQYLQYQIIAEAEENHQGDSFFIVFSLSHTLVIDTLSLRPQNQYAEFNTFSFCLGL